MAEDWQLAISEFRTEVIKAVDGMEISANKIQTSFDRTVVLFEEQLELIRVINEKTTITNDKVIEHGKDIVNHNDKIKDTETNLKALTKGFYSLAAAFLVILTCLCVAENKSITKLFDVVMKIFG